jgi:hypothetical protein
MPNRWRVQSLNWTRWWRHNTKRWWVAVYATLGLVNLGGYFGWWGAKDHDPITLLVAVVMALFAAVNVRMGRREWEAKAALRRWQEDSKALAEWWANNERSK